MAYVKVILPLKLPWCPVYTVEEAVEAGTWVTVGISGKKYSGVVLNSDAETDLSPDKILPVDEIIRGIPPVTAGELRFWEFLSDYYLCSIGEVFKLAYPCSRIRSNSSALAVSERHRLHLEKIRSARISVLEKRISLLSTKQTPKSGVRLEAARSELQSLLDGPAEEIRKESFVRTPHNSPGKPLILHSSDRIGTYLEKSSETISSGRQVLVITSQKVFLSALYDSFSARFGDDVRLFSSDCSTAVRRRIADASRDGASVIVGTRSALFLPFRDLGLVIVDEEQDAFHKQEEPSPRLHARDAAIALAGIHEAAVVLGTASPSFESLWNVTCGKFRIERAACVDSEATVVDINAERFKRGMLGPVSRVLVREIMATDGPSMVIRCWEDEQEMDFAAMCPGKDVMVRTMQELRRDGARGAGLIGVLQADAFVSRDDFRADERAMQLLAQLYSIAPHVVLQTAVPQRFNGSRSLDELLSERKEFSYPPFTRIVDVILEDDSAKRLAFMSDRLSRILGAIRLPSADGRMRLRKIFNRDRELRGAKLRLLEQVRSFEREMKYPGHIVIDVDPQ